MKKKEKVIKTEKELINFLNREGIARRLKLFAKLMLPKGFNLRVNFHIGDTCFTDWKSVTIGVSKQLIGKTDGEIILHAKANCIHEVGHILYSPEEVYKGFIEDYTEKLAAEPDLAGVSKGLLQKFASYFMNAIEDGHNETCAITENDSFRKYITYSRSLWWKANKIPSLQKRLDKGENPEACELFDVTFAFATLSTMGLYPRDFENSYGTRTELYDMLEDIKPDIFRYISTFDMKDALAHLWTIVDKINPWVVNLLKNIPESEAENALDELLESMGGSGLGSGQGAVQQGNSGQQQENSGQQNNSQGQNSQSMMQGQDQESTSGVRFGLNTDIDATDYGTDMNKIVDEALRNAEEECLEVDEKLIIQADFDDLRTSGSHEEEDEGNFDSTYRKEVEEYYSKLDASHRGGCAWDKVGFKRQKYVPTISSQIPEDVKKEAYKIEKAFKDILVDKVSANYRNRRSGLLNTNDLWKLRTRDYKVFEQKKLPDDTASCIKILVDGSGSMGGDKFIEALRACSVLEESLKKLVPLSISMFHYEYGNNVVHRDIKSFNSDSSINYSWLFANQNRATGSNMDGYSIRVATRELLRRSEEQKILITLSDGQPAGCDGYYGEHANNDVREAVNEARRKGIKVFNIFFGFSKSDRDEDLPGFIYMYQKGIVSCAPSEICSELIRIVKRELR